MSIDWKNGTLIKLSEVDNSSFYDLIQPILIEDEEPLATYKGIRDGVVFTTYNLIVINIQDVSGMKKSFALIPYRNIEIVEVETAGIIDIDSKIKIHVHGVGTITFEFTRGTDVQTIQQMISQGIFNGHFL